MESAQDLKEHLQEYRENLWKVLRGECSFAEKAAIVKYPYKEGDKISFWAETIIHNAAYDKLVSIAEIDTNKVFNLSSGDYEDSRTKINHPYDLGRRGNGHFIYMNSQWQSHPRKQYNG